MGDHWDIGLSTSWNGLECGGLVGAISGIFDLGCGVIEVALDGPVKDWEAAADHLNGRRGRCAAVAAPRTANGGGLCNVVDPDAAGRRRVLQAIRTAIAVAARFKTDTVVLPPARLVGEAFASAASALRKAVEARDDAAAAAVRQGLALERRRLRNGALDAFCRLVHEVSSATDGLRLAYAVDADPGAIPAAEDLQAVFDELGPRRLVLWRDTGAETLRSRLGLDLDGAWSFAGSRAAGFYLSDLYGFETGFPVGSGSIDWANWRTETGKGSIPRILKVSAGASRVAVAEALRLAR